MKPDSQSNTVLIDEIEEKKSKLTKKKEKKWVSWVNLPNPWPGSWDEDNPIKSKSNIEGPVTQVMRPIQPIGKKIKKNDLI